jgi:hypothetical protein
LSPGMGVLDKEIKKSRKNVPDCHPAELGYL